MELTTEQAQAYATVARLECMRIAHIKQQIDANPNMLAKDIDLLNKKQELSRQDLQAYAIVASCELAKVNDILDEAFKSDSSSSRSN